MKEGVCKNDPEVPAHTTLSMREFLPSIQITILKHPPYSPNLVPNELFLLPKIKEILKGIHFDGTDDIRSNTSAALKDIQQNQIQNCFEGWTRRWHWCVASQGGILKAVTVGSLRKSYLL
jgi:hypothetical protein